MICLHPPSPRPSPQEKLWPFLREFADAALAHINRVQEALLRAGRPTAVSVVRPLPPNMLLARPLPLCRSHPFTARLRVAVLKLGGAIKLSCPPLLSPPSV